MRTSKYREHVRLYTISKDFYGDKQVRKRLRKVNSLPKTK